MTREVTGRDTETAGRGRQDDSSQMPGVDLTARASSGPDELAVEYTVRNRTRATLGILNRMAGTQPNGRVDPVLRHAYVALDGRTLLVRAMRLPLPGRGIQITGAMIPFVTRIAPGDSATDRVVLRRPVAVDDPYRQMEATAAVNDPQPVVTASAPRDADAVALTVGVFRVEPPVALQPAPWPGAADLWVAAPASFRQVLLARRLALSAPVRVLDYQAVDRHD